MTTRTVAYCPVGNCPWDYELTSPRTESRGEGTIIVVPPPAGVTPDLVAVGVRAARQVLDGAVYPGNARQAGHAAWLSDLARP